MPATDRLNRLVLLVAELSRLDTTNGQGPTIQELAQRLGTTPKQINADIRLLTEASDDTDAEWLLSLRVSQVGDHLHLESRGPFRRPIRLTPRELLAVQVALEAEGEPGSALATRLGGLRDQLDPPDVAVEAPPGSRELADQLHAAIRDRARVEISYAAESAHDGARRVIHPYELANSEGHAYVHAWCESARGYRRFRLDRILGIRLELGSFEPRTDFRPIDGERVFVEPDSDLDEVEVRFAPAIARWIIERHPDCTHEEHGSVRVTYRVADPNWLMRHVLQYGPEAEIVGPPRYREAMRQALGWDEPERAEA